MANGSNLKTNIDMDTGGFEKGAKKVAKAAQDMGKTIGTSLGDAGRAIGANTGLVGDLAKNIENVTTLFRGMATAGGGAASSLQTAMANLGGAIAGLGITAAITAFQELNREAHNFEQRLQGVNLAASAKAYRSTYRQYLDDVTGAGEKTATLLQGLRNNFAEDWANITHPFASSEDREQARFRAESAAQLASEMVDMMREQRDLGVEIQKIDNQIAEAQGTFRNTQAATTERKEAEAAITELINQKYAKQIDLQQRMLDNVRRRNSLTTSTEEELDEEANLQKGLLALDGQRQQELNAMLRTSNSIAKSAGNHAAAAKETKEATVLTLEAAKELVEKERQLAELNRQNALMRSAARLQLDGSLPVINGSGLQAEAKALSIPALIRPVVDTEAAQESIIELAEVVESGVIDMAESFGTLIGDLINGEAAWGNFAQAGINAIADMLATVGKAFVTEGIGVLAADAALKFGAAAAPAAIAGGTAMIALAAAMRQTMSNASAGWSGGSGAAVATSSYSSGNAAASTYGREMVIRVSGTLEASGSKLKAVLNNEDNRTKITT